MKLRWISLLSVLIATVVFLPATSRADVKDNAKIFSQQAVDDADRGMKKMEKDHNRGLVIETFSAVPDDKKAEAAAHPDSFFKDWMVSRATEAKAGGVFVLICMDPHKIEVGAGKTTMANGDFTQADKTALYELVRGDMKDKNYDKALSDAVDNVDRAYTANINGSPNRSGNNQGGTQYNSSPARSNGGSPAMPGPMPRSSSGSMLGLGSIICLVIGAVIIFSLIKSIFRGNSGGGYGGMQGGQGYGGGNYAGGNTGGGNFGGNMPAQGGGGFGRGFLGGLLGGAVGGYAADKFEHRNDPSANAGGGNSGGIFGGGSGGGGGGGSFDSSPSDAGQGFGDNAVGGDFGSSGGGDSGGGGGGGGGDSGGGAGSSGGDF